MSRPQVALPFPPDEPAVPALQGLGALLPSSSGLVQYGAGARIFTEGDAGDCAYLIEEGYVEIVRGEGRRRLVVATLGPGEIFGEMAGIDGDRRSASALALHETVLMPISAAQLDDAIQSEHPLTQLLLRSLVRRLRQDAQRSREGERGADGRPVVDLSYSRVQARAGEYVRGLAELELAIKRQAFQLNYQPIVCLSDLSIRGFEALIRWPGANGSVRSPADFIPLAERSGMIVPLGEWVLRTGVAAWSRMRQHARLPEPFYVSVNVSPVQLATEERVEKLVRLIQSSEVDTAQLRLEVTEETLLSDPEQAQSALSRLRETGVKIMIDDFGTGYSSLSYLHQFPIDSLKIDRSFVNSVVGNAKGEQVVTAVVQLAHGLGMDVVAEGLENEEELGILKAKGCEYGQGYYFSKPLPLGGALQLLG